MNEFDVHQLAKSIADYLGWRYPEQDSVTWNARIVSQSVPPHFGLWISNERGRCKIAGDFGDLYKYLPHERHGKNEIGVSPTKPVAEIVKDIRRRLLPGYFADMLTCTERHTAHLERMKGVANAAMHFGAILNVTPPVVGDDERARFHLGFVGSIWGDVQIDTQSVDIKLDDVPFDVAAMMLVPIGEYIKAHRKEQDNAD